MVSACNICHRTFDSYKGVRVHCASVKKKEKVIIKRFDTDNYVVEDVSHSNDEIETNVKLNSCEILIEQRDNKMHEGNDYLRNLPQQRQQQFTSL